MISVAIVWTLWFSCFLVFGVETFCDGRQNQAQCFGALGGTVDIRLIDKIPERLRFVLLNSNKIVRWTGNGPVRLRLETLEFTFNNGTMRINNLNRTDDGEYRLEILEAGKRTAVRTLQLNIQAPVSSVQLKSECLSRGVKRMSCSSEGDSPQFSWTLDGDTLRDDQLLSGNNETREITLRAPVLGELVCTVRNHISRASATLMTPTCDNVLLTLLLRALVVAIIFSGIFLYFTWKKMKEKKGCKIALASDIQMEPMNTTVIMVEKREKTEL